MTKPFKHLFGPVPSRRLGLSLGVDLLLPKTCSLDCVYCESGKTTRLTTQRSTCVSPFDVISELDDFLSTRPVLDHITFSGWGEPVLNTGIARVVQHLKTCYPEYPTALLTNGTLFYMKQAREDVKDIDLIIASLDAVSPGVFQALNRPHPDLDPDKIVQGLIDLRSEFTHELWLEIFIVPGLNDTDEELLKLSEAAGRIRADKIQLNTLDRPGTEAWVKPAEKSDLERISRYFETLEITGRESCEGMEKLGEEKNCDEMILQLVMRRPCTCEDMVKSLGFSKEWIDVCLKRLMEDQRIRPVKMERGVFYRIM